MSVPEGLHGLVELVAEIAMWKQKATDLEKDQSWQVATAQNPASIQESTYGLGLLSDVEM